MKYFEVTFTLAPCTQDACDLLAAMAGEAGFETFEETETGMMAYVQQQMFDREALDAVIAGFPIDGIHIIYNIREAEDRDWNEQWEQEGFEPIVVSSERLEVRGKRHDMIVIHDGRHLPANPSSLTADHSPLSIEIDAHLAFGTGTHETTRMLCATLLALDLRGANVLDCGCGTGILGICALKLGAMACTAYDIDEWSTDNTRHNAVINQVDDRLTALHGDATLLDRIDQKFDVVMANINRNILLADMERFHGVMRHGATLLLSGFYESDVALLESKATSLGLRLDSVSHDGEWAMMVLRQE